MGLGVTNNFENMPQNKIIVATRKSPLALAQTELTRGYLKEKLPEVEFEVLPLVTTGDRRQRWSLEKEGGKGLFTKELEMALLEGRCDLAVHSAKDLPTSLESGLAIAGYLPRELAHDVLVAREGCTDPGFIATGSPRRRAQAKLMFPQAVWGEIRGNVDTRLNKISRGDADATILAAAGLKRLGFHSWAGVEFKPFDVRQMVPAAGQGAVALECREEEVDKFSFLLDRETGRAVSLERHFLGLLGGGCHNSYAVHFIENRLLVFVEESGFSEYDMSGYDDDSAIKKVEDIASKFVAK